MTKSRDAETDRSRIGSERGAQEMHRRRGLEKNRKRDRDEHDRETVTLE